VFHLLGDGVIIPTTDTMTPVVAIVLAAVAGFSQLFSP
jgi:hypothetical protein